MGAGFVAWLIFHSLFRIGALCPLLHGVWVVVIPRSGSSPCTTCNRGSSTRRRTVLGGPRIPGCPSPGANAGRAAGAGPDAGAILELLGHGGALVLRRRPLGDAGANLVLNSHEYNCERFAPQNPTGRRRTPSTASPIPSWARRRHLARDGGAGPQQVGARRGHLRRAGAEGRGGRRDVGVQAGRGQLVFSDSGSLECHDEPPSGG